MGTPRPVKDPQAAAKAAERRRRAARDLRWWQGRMLADKALSDAEWTRYTSMLDQVHAAGLVVTYYRATCAEQIPPALRESIAEHHRRSLNGTP